MKTTRMIAIIVISIGLTGCLYEKDDVQKNELQIGRYVLHSTVKSIAVYRLDTATGEILMCWPSGTAETGYGLVCNPNQSFHIR